MGTGLPSDLSPAMRQDFFEPLDEMFRNPAEHIAEPGKRFDPAQFTRSDEAAQDGRGRSPLSLPKKIQWLRLCTRQHKRNWTNPLRGSGSTANPSPRGLHPSD